MKNTLKAASHATTPVVAALTRAMRTQARTLAARLPEARAEDASAVHDARVASRRLREAAAIFVDVPGTHRLRKRVRRITRALGPVREMDVTLVELEAISAHHDWSADAIAEVKRRIANERARRMRTLAKARLLSGEALTSQAEAVIAATQTPETGALAERRMRKRLRRRIKHVAAAIDECGVLYVPERLHALRIAVKKLRYALEMAQLGQLARLGPAIRALKQMQERLGELHDLQILLASTEGAAAAKRRGAQAEGLRRMVNALERDCRDRHAGLLPRLPELAARLVTLTTVARPALDAPRPRMLRLRGLPAAARRPASGF